MLKKIFVRFCEFLLILLIFVGLTFSVTFYRLHKAPLNVNFALETIERALADDVRGLNTNVLEASLFWPNMKGPILLLLDDVHILQNGEERFSLDRAAVSIARLPLLAGQVKPEAVILEGTSLQLIRDENNEVRVALDFDDSDEVNTKQTQAVDPFSILDAVLSGDPNNDPLFGLKAFEIRDAKIFVEDQKQQKTWSIPDFSVVFTRSDKEIDVDLSYMMKGQIQRTDAGFTLGLSNSDSSFYTAKFHFQNFDPALFGSAIGFKSVQGRGLLLEGQSSVNISKDWKILTADVGIKSASGQLNIEGLYGDRYLDVAHVNLDVDYDANSGAVSLRQLSMDVQDVGLVISSDVKLENKLITVPLKISGKDLAVDDIGVIFPDALKGTIAEEWGRKNLSVGTIKEVTVSVPLSFSPDENGVWITSVGAVESDFTFENMTVDYSTPLMPAVGVDGFGSFRDDDLTIEAIKGHIKDLTTNKVRVVISDLSVAGGGMADIDVHVEGPFQRLIEYIEKEPINLDGKLGFDAKEVKGHAVADIQVDFPTIKGLKIEEVKVKAKAVLTDVYIPRIVKGMPLTGGPMTLDAKAGQFTLSGKGKLDGRSLDLKYTQYLEPKGAPFSQKVEASLVADKTLRDNFGIGLEDYVSGDLPLSIVYTEKANKKAKIDVDVDLTSVEFFIDPLNYNKPIGKKGRAKMKIFTYRDAIEEVSDLDITLHDGEINNGRLIFAKVNGEVDVQRAELPDIHLPENVLSVNLEQMKDRSLKLVVGAQKLDVRRFLGRDEEDKSSAPDEDGSRIVISGHVDRLRVSDKGILHGAKLYVDVSKKGNINQLEMDARVGRGDIYLRYKPDPFGQLAFRLEANDAGATLKAMDLYEDMRGGTLLIEAVRPPKGHKNDLDGIALFTNFKVVNTPALARLLNAMSLTGMQQLLNGDGIEFGKMKTNFSRKKKSSGTEILFKDGRTSGSEVGLTFEGKVNQDNGLVDIQGTIIPLSTINKVVGSIPIVGQLLTGGGALIAATYTMKRDVGGKDDVTVSVNPLSALTPGILRKILFEGDNPADK